MTISLGKLASIARCQIGSVSTLGGFVETVRWGTYFVRTSRPEFGVTGLLRQLRLLHS